MRKLNPFRWPRWARCLFFMGIFFLLLFVFRYPIMRSAGNALTVAEDSAKSDAILVLGGNSFERGLHAATLYGQGRAPRLVCTGGNVPSLLAALDTVLFEAEVTRGVLLGNSVPDSLVTVLTSATSTLEEAREVSVWCRENNIQSLTVVSNAFHLGRVKRVFEKNCPGVSLRYSPAPSLQYDEREWWKSEEGLIMVNNEWMKRLYYLLRGDH